MLDLKRYAESRAYVAEGYRDATIGDLEAFGPATVRVTANRQHHFVVFLGRQGDQIHIADSAIGNRSMNLKAFETMWKVALKITRAARSSGNAAGANSSVEKQSGSWNISTPAGD
jgi:predicted double-glycine peptidase